jgi:hypothetical protein
MDIVLSAALGPFLSIWGALFPKPVHRVTRTAQNLRPKWAAASQILTVPTLASASADSDMSPCSCWASIHDVRPLTCLLQRRHISSPTLAACRRVLGAIGGRERGKGAPSVVWESRNPWGGGEYTAAIEGVRSAFPARDHKRKSGSPSVKPSGPHRSASRPFPTPSFPKSSQPRRAKPYR